MMKLWVRKTVAALLMFAVVLSCTGYETVLAASEDDGIVLETAPDVEDDALTAGDEMVGPALSGDDEADEDKAADAAAEGEEEGLTSDGADGDTGKGLKIKEIKKLPVSERIIAVPQKGTEEEAVAVLPETWKVTLGDGTEKDVKVSWKCIDDFDDKDYTSFVFKGEIADKTVSIAEDEEILNDLVMELYFEDAGIEKDGLLISVLSPNTIMTGLDKEQGKDASSEAFLNAYGSGADEVINTDVSYAASQSVLSASAYKIMKGISPTPDNYLYNKLTVEEKRFYNNIDAVMTDFLYYGKECTKGVGGRPMTPYISAGSMKLDQMVDVLNIYLYDNPQAFFFSTRPLIDPDVDSKQGSSVAITIYPDTDTPAKLKARAEQIASNIQTVSKKVNKKNNEYNRMRLAQSLICKRLTFPGTYRVSGKDDWSDWTDGSTEYYKSLMSAMSDGSSYSMSGGYAKSMVAVARLAGLDAFVITSPKNIMNPNTPEWNKIRLYGQWFCADPGVDDTDDPTGDGCAYEHFMKSDKTINSDSMHAWDKKWKSIAPVSSGNYIPDKTKKFKITYKLNGGTNSIFNPSHYTASSTKITLRDPVKKGRKFAGWYTDGDFDNKIKYILGSNKKDYTLHARWKLIKYKIKYKLPKGVKNVKGNPVSYNATTKTITLKNPTRTGYKFKGWYTDKARKNRIKKIKGSDCRDYKLYSKWALKKYKINYKITKDVDNSANPAYYTIKTKSFKLQAATRPGYNFKGWYTDDDFDHRIRTINTKKLKAYTVYPKWTIKQFKIRYRLGGGTNSSKNPTKYNIESGKIKLKDPKKKGYTFKGWYTDAEFTNRIRTIKPGDLCDYTLYAKWVKNKK